MALTGRKPKDDGQKVTRHPLTQDWTEVLDVPYEGDVPAPGRLPAGTKRWWAAVSTMPHCVLWSETDWQYALDTARLHAAFSRGELGRAGELRIREKQMGTTLEARRDLRIRYVSPTAPADGTGVPSDVADFEAERRRRLMEND